MPFFPKAPSSPFPANLQPRWSRRAGREGAGLLPHPHPCYALLHRFVPSRKAHPLSAPFPTGFCKIVLPHSFLSPRSPRSSALFPRPRRPSPRFFVNIPKLLQKLPGFFCDFCVEQTLTFPTHSLRMSACIVRDACKGNGFEMNTLFCFQPQNNMPQPPFAAQREKGWVSCAHFAPSCADATAIIMDTILMVSIFVIPALRLLYAVL